VPPPVRQRASTSTTAAAAAASNLKARVPPPVPPRGSPRRKETQDGRAHSTTPGIAPKEFNPNTTHSDTCNTLQLPLDAVPRFGERRSPSNVQDWLELHDLFIGNDSPVHVPLFTPPPHHLQHSGSVRRRESLQSAYSTARSESSFRRQQPRLLSHVDIFQRQNSFMARSERSSVGSIVRSFPPIRAESYRTARTSVSGTTQQSPRRVQQKQQRHQKRNRYLHCADLALGEDPCDSQEDNLLQSMNAFLEVKRELESPFNRKRALPVLQVSSDDEHVQARDQELPQLLTPQRPRRGKRRAPKAAPSTIPESTDTQSNVASYDLRRNSCA